MDMRLHKAGNDRTVRRVDHPFISVRLQAAADFNNQAVFNPDISVYNLFLLIHCNNLRVFNQNVRHNPIPPRSIHSLLMQADNTKRLQKYAAAYFRSQKFTVPGRDP
ncbi:hypothetical protein D3C80_1619860 [compost metagenome]